MKYNLVLSHNNEIDTEFGIWETNIPFQKGEILMFDEYNYQVLMIIRQIKDNVEYYTAYVSKLDAEDNVDIY